MKTIRQMSWRVLLAFFARDSNRPTRKFASNGAKTVYGRAKNRLAIRTLVLPFFVTPLIVAVALFMENLDATIIATSLPAIARDLHQDPIALKLALTSYLLAQAVFIPASGWAADQYGTKKIFFYALLVFTCGSILCGLSSSLTQFVGARVVQGAGAALMTPVGRLALFRSVEKHDIVRAMAWLTVPALVGPMIGPPLGGLISTFLDWRWNFWINVPIGALGAFCARRYMPNFYGETRETFDFAGFALSGLGLGGLIFGLSILGRGFVALWLNLIIVGAGALFILLYIRHAREAKNPILDLKLLELQNFRASILGGFLFRVGVGATPFLLPLMLQLGFGMSPLESGLTTFVSSAGALMMKPVAARVLARFGFRDVLIVNGLLSALLLAAAGFFTATTPQAVMALTLFIGGLFKSLQFTALNALSYADVEETRMGKATALAAVAQQLAWASGVAVGAETIEFARRLGDGADFSPQLFAPAFFVVALIACGGIPIFLRLRGDAGAALARERA